jgi:citrate/tricarballylate utilization protein
MPSTDSLKEAERVMVVCNACRYCEGFCAVFPAMELRRTFAEPDLVYLANLCHSCRDCYYACQYAPPHEFAVNVPRALAELRLETYKEFAWPVVLKGLFQRNGLAVALITAAGVFTAMLMTILFQGPSVFWGTHTGVNAFYKVIPYTAMVLPISLQAVFILVSLWKSFDKLWRATCGTWDQLLNPRNHLHAVWDALRLRYLAGGGHGCNYPNDRFSMIRRNFHHAVFYGFMLCLAATTVSAIYHHFLQKPAPYPLLSWPVMLGTAGGLALVIGTAGLLYLKGRMDKVPAAPGSFGMDAAFLALLFLTSFTGLLLLVLRETPAMGTLLAAHLGLVVGLFITLPYGKFVHAVYRYAALVRNAMEQSRERTKGWRKNNT